MKNASFMRTQDGDTARIRSRPGGARRAKILIGLFLRGRIMT